jgi:hypothetical protein
VLGGRKLLIGVAETSGSLDQGAIQREVKRASAQCYRPALLDGHELHYEGSFWFDIDSNGQAVRISVGCQFTEVQECVAGVIGSITFPPSEGTTPQ